MVIVYSAFSAAYYWLPADYKVLFVFVLPSSKLVMQNVVAWTISDLEEYQPDVVVFCVSVFNALFMSKCMQTARSRLTYALATTLETIQGILAFRRLQKTMTHLQALAEACNRSSMVDKNLLEGIVSISQEPEAILRRKTTIRILSPIKPHLCHQNTIALDRLASDDATGHSGTTLGTGRRSLKIMPLEDGDMIHSDHENAPSSNPIPLTSARRSSSSIQPLNALNDHVEKKEAVSAPAHTLHPTPKHEIMRLSLKLLFENEYHVLTEFVESVIPMMYAIYIAIVGHLSGAEYYPETSGKDRQQIQTMVLNIVLYTLLEALSFVVMHLCVKWKSGLSLASILAFVIENQAQELSGRLCVWYLCLLQFTLAHCGAYLVVLVLSE